MMWRLKHIWLCAQCEFVAWKAAYQIITKDMWRR